MQKRSSRNKTETRALNTYLKLMRASESTTARVHRHLSSAGLTLSQFGALEALYHLGPLSQKEIGEKVLRSSGNMTMVIDNLEKRGLVRRERSNSDRRCYSIHLTNKGNSIIRQIFPRHAAMIANEMSVLSTAEQNTLAKLCRKLGLRN